MPTTGKGGSSSETTSTGEAATSVDATSEESARVGASTAKKGTQRSASETAARASALLATGRGVSDSAITVGVILVPGLAEMRAAMVGSENCGNDCGDNRIQAQAVIDLINARGGVAKRKLVPIYHDLDIKENFDVSAQEACSKFTEDHQVFAVVDQDGSGPWAEQMTACLAKRGTPRIGPMETDTKFADDFAPYYYDPSGITLTRAGRVHVAGLVKLGFFEPAAKIGLLRYDRPTDERAAEQGIKLALAAQGIKLADEVAVSYPSSISDLSVTASQLSSASLRFKTNLITHVLPQDRRDLAYLFGTNAESQSYRPRYGLNSFSQPHDLQGQLPASQLRRAVGVGWMPLTDVDSPRIPTPNATRQACIDAMKKVGVAAPELNQKALSYCDDLFFLKVVGDSAKTLTTAGFQAAAEALGTTFEPALTHGARFGPGIHDGASSARPLAFDDACSCFYYVGGADPVD